MTKQITASLAAGVTLLSAAAGFAQTPTAAQHSAMMKHQMMMKHDAMMKHGAMMHHGAAPNATPPVAPSTP